MADRARVRRHEPWLTRFEIAGQTFGGELPYSDDPLLEQFVQRVPVGATVLELGSLEGGHSLELAQRGYRVTGLEGREENLERARYVRRLLRQRVHFVHANLESTPLESFGRFDCVLCAGLLYHLPEPWRLLDQLAQVAPRLFLRSHYAEEAAAELHGLRGCWYTEAAREEPLAGLSPRSFWLTLPSLLNLPLERDGSTRSS